MAKGKYAEWLEEDNLVLLRGWATDGLTDEQIAHNIGIRRETLWDWKKRFPNIANALKRGKEVANYIVENELFMSAQTRTITVRKPIKVKTIIREGNQSITEEHVEYAEEEVVVPANTTAQIFWLKNRKPEKWRDKPEVVIAETYEDDGLMAALDAQVDEDMEDDSWMIQEENE